MAGLTGLFQRGSSYYMRVVLPPHHPLQTKYKNGTLVTSLGHCSQREAIKRGTIKRAEVLFGAIQPDILPTPSAENQVITQPKRHTLRDIHLLWTPSKARSKDTISACLRAVCLYEEFTGDVPIEQLTRDLGRTFIAWLQHPDRKTTSKTARDRLIWVKSLLQFASQDLGLIRQSPWAYWIPLLGLYTGARVGELAQLRVTDVLTGSDVPMLSITNEGDQQRVKTKAGLRNVPIHSELIRLGFLDYVASARKNSSGNLWPDLPTRDGKPGGYFSQWFGIYRRDLGFGKAPDFHCFRHTVRTQMAEAGVPEAVIDTLVGHEVSGSVGAKVYTHRSPRSLSDAIEAQSHPALSLALPRLFPVP